MILKFRNKVEFHKNVVFIKDTIVRMGILTIERYRYDPNGIIITVFMETVHWHHCLAHHPCTT